MTVSAALLLTERAEMEGWGDQVEEWNAMSGTQIPAQCALVWASFPETVSVEGALQKIRASGWKWFHSTSLQLS